MRRGKAVQGFTLMELAIVLGIIAIMSGGMLVAVAGRSSERRALQNASLALQADIRYAQRRTIVEGQRYGVTFDFAYNRYHVGPATRDTHGRWTVNHDRTIYLPPGVTMRRWLTSTGMYYEGTTHQITYLPRGTVSVGATYRLRTGLYQQDVSVVPSGGRAQLLGIDPRSR